mgnify:CR=1 FL=1
MIGVSLDGTEEGATDGMLDVTNVDGIIDDGGGAVGTKGGLVILVDSASNGNAIGSVVSPLLANVATSTATKIRATATDTPAT